MAEIKDARSAFEALDRDVVQEWLAHPGTIELTRQIGLAEAEVMKRAAQCSVASRLDDAELSRLVRACGVELATLSDVRNLLSEAQRYANSI